MKKESVTPTAADLAVDPHRARRAEVTGTIQRVRRRNHILTLLLALALAATVLSSYGLVVCAAKPSHVPVRVEVDRLGRVMAAGPVSRLEPPGHTVVEAELRRLIANLRTVYPEPIAQRDIQKEGRARLRDQAINYIDEYFRRPELNPFVLGHDVYRRVDVYRALPVEGQARSQGGESWRLSWRETVSPVGGGAGEECEWEGIATVEFDPGVNETGGEAAIIANPYGIWVVGLSWQQSSPCKPLVPQPRGGA
jgi:type IV secretory pathway TrbF-like protein